MAKTKCDFCGDDASGVRRRFLASPRSSKHLLDLCPDCHESRRFFVQNAYLDFEDGVRAEHVLAARDLMRELIDAKPEHWGCRPLALSPGVLQVRVTHRVMGVHRMKTLRIDRAILLVQYRRFRGLFVETVMDEIAAEFRRAIAGIPLADVSGS